MRRFTQSHIVLFTGQSGSGKDTLISGIKKRLGSQVYTINNGDLVRSLSKGDDPMSKAVKRHNESGYLVPTFVFYGAIANKLDIGLSGGGLILWNGSPRQLRELGDIDETLKMLDMKGFVIHVDASDNVCRERMLTRQSELKKAGKPLRPEDIDGKIDAWNRPSGGRDTMARLRSQSPGDTAFEYYRINTDELDPDDVLEKVLEKLQERGIVVLEGQND